MAAGDPINGLLTGGLGVSLPANSMIITAWVFNLGPVKSQVRLERGGGPYPAGMGAWNQVDNIQDFYKPVDPKLYEPEQPLTPYQVPVFKDKIIFKVQIGKRDYERTFMVRQNRRKIVVKMLNILNITTSKIKVTANTFISTINRAAIKITNFKNRK